MKILYKGNYIVDDDATIKKLLTAGKYCEDDIEITTESGVIEIDDPDVMDANLTEENDGKLYLYVGTDTDKYINGRYYKVQYLNIAPVIDLQPYTETSTVKGCEEYTSLESVLNLDPDKYSKIYKSKNFNINNSYGIAKIDITAYKNFTIWINSYAESRHDYSVLSKLDATTYPTADTETTALSGGNTKSYQKNPRNGLNETNWRKITYEVPQDGNNHWIYFVFRKDHSVNSSDDTGCFVCELTKTLHYVEYLLPQGIANITSTSETDVGQYKTAQIQSSTLIASNIKNNVNILGIVGTYTGESPTGTISITSNGTYDVTNYASADVNVSGGGGDSGYKLTVLHCCESDDGVKLVINETNEVWLFEGMQLGNEYRYFTQIQIPGKVETFKVYNADHRGTYPETSSSWARYRYDGGNWTNLNVRNSGTITLTGDAELQILSGTCLNKGTLITMSDGSYKPVEEIEVGDYVKGYDGKALKVLKSQKGQRAFGNDRDVWNFEDGKQIITTFRHRFYNIEHQKMMYLNDWQIGEHAYTEEGEAVALVEHIHEDTPCMHFSLWCEEQNYFAGGLLAGNRHTGEIHIKGEKL